MAVAERVYTSSQVAQYIGVSVDALHKAEIDGRIPAAPRELGGDDRVYTPGLVAIIRDYFAGPSGT